MSGVKHSSYLVIHKKEWERIKTQSKADDEEVPVNTKEKSIAELNKLSQKWIKNWPTSVQGVGDRLQKKKDEKKKQELALIKQYATKLMRESASPEAIKKARQMIFERSSYGKQLWGALIESKVLEEREAQIKFKNELKKQQADLDKAQEQLNTLPALNKDEDENRKRKKSINVQFAKFNMELEEKNKATSMKIKEEEILCEKIDEAFIKPIVEKEKEKALTLKRLQKEAVEKYEAEQKEIAKIKAIRKGQEETLTETYRKEKDRIQCKINAAHKNIISEFQNSKKSKHVYDIIEKNQKEKLREYDDFIEKGLRRYEEIQRVKELETKEKEQLKKTLLMKLNDTKINTNPLVCKKKTSSKNVSVRSNLLLKTQTSRPKDKLETEYKFTEPTLTLTEPPTLKEKLKERVKEKYPFTGTAAAHKMFAEQAAIVLQDCKYKHLPRKVIDNYRKINELDPTSLPVINYYNNF